MNFNVTDSRQLCRKRGEEFRINQQFAFACNVLAHAISQLCTTNGARRLVQLDRGMERLEQGKTANVTDEDASTRADRAESARDYVHQIVEIGKILNNRVDDYGIELVLNTVKLVCSFARQRDIWKVQFRTLDLVLQEIHGRLGDVGSTEELSFGSNSEEQKAGTAADFPNALRI